MKKLKSFVCLILCAALLFGCGEKTDPSSSPSAPSATVEPTFETITIFTIDTGNMQIVPSQVKKEDGNDSLVYICDLVEDNLDDDEIHVTGATLEKTKVADDTAVIVFDAEGKPLKNCVEDMETLILDCFANSILDNVEGVHYVVFRSSEGAYKSESLKLGENEAYASK
ncbi:MAG: hypothetical protein K5639_01575 [Eubacterium sp.]|nr:hypothetical protein [Eubacterium sp.]